MLKGLFHQLALGSIALVLLGVGFFGSTLAGMSAHVQAKTAYNWVGPKAYDLGLGDSLAFGYQENFDWSNGYVQDYYANLHWHGVTTLTNYGCNGESSTSMILGGCPYSYLLHDYYIVPQLKAAAAFLQAHPGQVSPVTLDIGANDVIPDIDASTCTVAAKWTTDLATLKSNLNTVILPQLVSALTVNGRRTGDLILMNYYNPYAKACPQDLNYILDLNSTIANAARAFNLPVADVFSAFGGKAHMADTICSYSWICNANPDIHPTDLGYQVIANTFIRTTGY